MRFDLFGCLRERARMRYVAALEAENRTLRVALRKAIPLLPQAEQQWAQGALLTAALSGMPEAGE